MLAEKTGWTEHFLLWELPLSRALQYYHCALRASGAWTVPASQGAPTLSPIMEAALKAATEAATEEVDSWI